METGSNLVSGGTAREIHLRGKPAPRNEFGSLKCPELPVPTHHLLCDVVDVVPDVILRSGEEPA